MVGRSNGFNIDTGIDANSSLTNTDIDGEFLELEKETIEDENQSFWKRIKENGVLRLRIIHTVLISWTCFAIGWRLAMVGPTFSDLLQIIDVDVSIGSWLLTTFYIGNVCGSLIAGFLYDRFAKLPVIISCMVMLSLSSAIIPWCSSFALMLLAHVLSGASYGACDVVTITDVLHVWGSRSAPILQLTQFVYGLGAILSPLVSAPFLSEPNKYEEQVQATGNITNISGEHFIQSYQAKLIENITITTGNGPEGIADTGPGRIYIAYLLAALLSFVNAIAFIPYYILNKDAYRKFTKDTKRCQSKSQKVGRHKFSKRTKFYFICAVSMLLMLHMLVERNFVSYFTSYVTKKDDWSKTTGSAVISVYYIASAIGRLIASSILACISLTKAVVVYLGLATCALLGLFGTTFADTSFIIWICVVILGFSLGPLFGAWFSWLSKNVVLASGRITGAMYIIGVSACCFFPPLIGYLMETYTYDWLIYILLILVPVMMITFLVIVYIHKRLIIIK